jgi:TonB-linked SusC/RagA family outer membrane protein
MVSNEPFWGQDLKKVITKLKVKGTYGLVGNDAIGSSRFLYLSEVNMNDSGHSAAFGTDGAYSKDGISLSRYANDAITWEVSKKGNIGIELGLFDAIDFQAEYYEERRENILMTRAATSSTMGLSAQPVANIGKAQGEGFDMSIDVNKYFNKNWWIQARVNFTYATSKYLVYEEPTYDEAPWKSRVGYSLGQQWGYLAERLFVDDNEVKNSPYQSFGEYAGGDIKYHDVNGDGQITSLDSVPIGWPTTPELIYGFGFSVGFKNIDFSCFFQGLARESFWIDTAATAPFYQEHQLLKAYADSHWSEDNRDLYALWPRLSATLNGNNNQRSTWFMRDGSFLRLKSLEIGYTFRTKKWKDTSFRLYLSGTNLLTFSNFKLWDPEMAGNGLGYPVQRVFNIGLNINL